MITSGLLRALQGKGIEDIAELTYTDRKALVTDFKAGWGGISKSSQEILIPQITLSYERFMGGGFGDKGSIGMANSPQGTVLKSQPLCSYDPR